MTRQEMINLLGLKPNFTEQELKKAYRKAARDNHPDLHPGDKVKEQRFKDINNVYEELNKKFGNKKNQGKSYEEITIEQYRKQILWNIKQKLMVDNSYLIYEDFKDFSSKINGLVQILVANMHFKAQTKSQIDNLVDTFWKKQYKLKLENFVSKYYKDNYIDENEVEETIDCTANLNDFFAKLLEINKKYNKESQYISEIKASVDEYLNNPLYASLKDMIHVQVNRCLSTAKISKYKDLDNIIANLIVDVEMIIKQYEKDLKRFNAIREDLKELYGSDIIDMVLGFKDDENIMSNLMSVRGISQDEIQMIIEQDKMEQSPSTINARLLNGFEKIISDKKNIRKSIEVIKPIHDAIEEKFKQCFLSHLGASIEAQKSVINIYDKYLEFYKLARKGEISLEDYKKLESLTFTDFEKDNSLLQNLCSKEEEKVENNNELDENPRKVIFVRKGRNNSKPYETFGYLVTSGEDMYMITPAAIGGIISSKITEKELEENYVTFDKFMKNMNFDGRRSSYWAMPYIVLYVNETNQYGVVYDDKTGKISIDDMYQYKHRYKEEDYAKTSLPYENKDRFVLAILEMIKKRLENYNRRMQSVSSELNKLPKEDLKIIENKYGNELKLNLNKKRY